MLLTPSRADKPATIPADAGYLRANLPVHISGCNLKHQYWETDSRVHKTTAKGFTTYLGLSITKGAVLLLEFPIDAQFAGMARANLSLKIYGFASKIANENGDQELVEIEIIGEHPPAFFAEKPWLLFTKPATDSLERRGGTRRSQSEIVWVEYYRDPEGLISIEQGCTDNVSATGARICVQSPPLNYDRVKIFALRFGFQATADVQNQYLGPDGIMRLCVHFVDECWPDVR